MSRMPALLLAAALLALAGPSASSAGSTAKCGKGHARNGKPCKPKKAKAKPFAQGVTVTLVDGSSATLAIGGTAPRTAALTGSLTGEIPGGYKIGKANKVVLRRGLIHVGAGDVLTDDCPAPPVAAIDPASSVRLAPNRPSSALLHTDGSIAATAATVMRTVLDIRNGACGTAPVTTGYADTPLNVTLTGKIGAGGLQAVTLDSAPTTANVSACLSPGTPTTKCAGAPLTYPVAVTVHLVVKVTLAMP